MTSVWILPVEGPREACLLAGFLLSVGDLDWTGEGIVVSASVCVDREAAEAAAGTTISSPVQSRSPTDSRNPARRHASPGPSTGRIHTEVFLS